MNATTCNRIEAVSTGHAIGRTVFAVMSLSMLSLGSVPRVAAQATPSFQGVGSLVPAGSSSASAVSADGLVVTGQATAPSPFLGAAVMWTQAGGLVPLLLEPATVSDFGFSSTGISADGSVIVGIGGNQQVPFGSLPWRWTAATGLETLDVSAAGFDMGSAFGISDDGVFIVGSLNDASGDVAFRWSSDGGFEVLGDLPGGFNGRQAHAASINGSVIVGTGNGASGPQAFRWTSADGLVGLGTLPGHRFSGANDVSIDGRVVVGTSSPNAGLEAFRWTAAGGMVGLGDLPGGTFVSAALAVSANGRVVAGGSSIATTAADRAMIWTPETGMIDLQVLLSDELGLDLSGWNLFLATGVSADATTIVGVGTATNDQGGQFTQGWVATIPPFPVPADIDDDGNVNLADVAIMQNLFSLGASADLDADGDTDLADHAVMAAELGP